MAALLGLGALHGINPAMGWLFAAALGLQERSTTAVWRALPPLALGHALSVAAFAAAAAAAGTLLAGPGLRLTMAALLVAAGAHRLWRGHMHFRYGGMRMSGRQLVVWSFLMATAHGAGLMVIPFLPHGAGASTGAAAAHGMHGHHMAATAPAAGDLLLAGQATGLVASLLHTASYLATAGLLALIVYHQAAFRVLRTAWINLDVIWAAALIITGVLVAVPLPGGT